MSPPIKIPLYLVEAFGLSQDDTNALVKEMATGTFYHGAVKVKPEGDLSEHQGRITGKTGGGKVLRVSPWKIRVGGNVVKLMRTAVEFSVPGVTGAPVYYRKRRDYKDNAKDFWVAPAGEDPDPYKHARALVDAVGRYWEAVAEERRKRGDQRRIQETEDRVGSLEEVVWRSMAGEGDYPAQQGPHVEGDPAMSRFRSYLRMQNSPDHRLWGLTDQWSRLADAGQLQHVFEAHRLRVTEQLEGDNQALAELADIMKLNEHRAPFQRYAKEHLLQALPLSAPWREDTIRALSYLWSLKDDQAKDYWKYLVLLETLEADSVGRLLRKADEAAAAERKRSEANKASLREVDSELKKKKKLMDDAKKRAGDEVTKEVVKLAEQRRMLLGRQKSLREQAAAFSGDQQAAPWNPGTLEARYIAGFARFCRVDHRAETPLVTEYLSALL